MEKEDGLVVKQSGSRIKTRTAELYWQDENIIRLDIMDEELDLKDCQENMLALKNSCNGQPRFVLIDARTNWTATKEAREITSKNELVKNIHACAVIVNSLAIRLIVNFFIKNGKLQATIKIFNDEVKALQWLNENVIAKV